jgi:hypothetical protein
MFNVDEIEIYDEAFVYKRSEYWQTRMWLGKETNTHVLANAYATVIRQ